MGADVDGTREPTQPDSAASTAGPSRSFRGRAGRFVHRFRVWIVAVVVGAVGASIAGYVQFGIDHVTHAVFDKGPGAPFTVEATLGAPPGLDWCDGNGVKSWVFGQPANELRPPTVTDLSDPGALDAWAAGARGVPATGSELRMTISGTSQDAVVLEAMRVVVVKRTGLLRGTQVYFTAGCGGLTPYYFSADLDRDPAGPVVAKPGRAGPPDFKTIPAQPFPHKVSASEPEQLYLQLDATTCTCEVYVLMDWKSPTSSGTLAIKRDSRTNEPFRIAGNVGSHSVLPDRQRGGWNPLGYNAPPTTSR